MGVGVVMVRVAVVEVEHVMAVVACVGMEVGVGVVMVLL